MQLLISVTSGVEAQAALQGGADIIDVKNPAEGALGAAAVAALHQVAALLPADRVSSAALGESTSEPGVLALAAYGAVTLGVRYVKLGLRMSTPGAAIALLRLVQSSLQLVKTECHLIAVGYADAAEIDAVSWQWLPEIAHTAGIRGCMIDTASKDGRRLFDYCAEPALANWIAECRQANLLCALAGSLNLADLPALRRLQPDVAGFRGAACRGDRVKGQVDSKLVAALRAGLPA
jgi:uncharacterized protein (UPF0264 family)